MRKLIFIGMIIFLFAGCSGQGNFTPTEVPDPVGNLYGDTERNFPVLALDVESSLRDAAWRPVPTITSPDALIPIDPRSAGPQFPGGTNCQSKYAFTRSTNAHSVIGPIYYGKADNDPYVIWNSGFSPVPSGDWVFFIQPPGASQPGPARWNLVTESVEYLDTSMVDPACNYLVPADEGNAYIYGAINPYGSDPLQGWIHIVKNGENVHSMYGSYLFPTLSSDASTAAWCYSSNPNSFGSRHAYVYDIASDSTTMIHECASNEEAQYITLTGRGEVAAFTVAIYGSTGMRDQEVWRWNGYAPSFKIGTNGYRWCERIGISNKGKYMVWAANPDPYTYAGYSIQGHFEGEESGFDVFTYDSNVQNLWPDIDSDGYIIYGNGVSTWSHYIPALASVYQGNLGAITDPGNLCRDFSFEN